MKKLLMILFLLAIPVYGFAADFNVVQALECRGYTIDAHFEVSMRGGNETITMWNHVDPQPTVQALQDEWVASCEGSVDDGRTERTKRDNWRDEELRDKVDCETMRLVIEKTTITIEDYPARVQTDYNAWCSIAPISFVVK